MTNMFDEFRARFGSVAATQVERVWMDERAVSVVGYPELMSSFAGESFEGGLYRIHGVVSGPVGVRTANDTFREYEGRLSPFAYDWMGRQFALNLSAVQPGSAVLMLEPGTGTVLQIPSSLVEFHNAELVDFSDAALAESFFRDWVRADPSTHPLGRDKCVGYKIPLFLGGRDELSNLEIVDFDVYWTILSQLRSGTISMRQGQSVSEIVGGSDS